MRITTYVLAFMCLILGSMMHADIFSLCEKWWDFNKANIRAVMPKRSGAANQQKTISSIGLDDLVGKRPSALDDVIDFFQHRVEREAQGIEMPRGILLCGPAGTGKTSFAKALARDLGMSYIEVAASDFEEVFVGLGASRIRSTFEQARNQQPCIVVIDEIDALGTRDSMYGSNVSRQLIDALLAEMDGIHSGGDVLVIGTTNEVSLVDKALRRPGRFDYVIEIPLPDEESRTDIINYYLRKKQCSRDLDITIVVQNTRGFSGAELKELVKRATIASVRNKHTIIMQDDLEDGLRQMLKEKTGRR